jgi:hypothetical protein
MRADRMRLVDLASRQHVNTELYASNKRALILLSSYEVWLNYFSLAGFIHSPHPRFRLLALSHCDFNEHLILIFTETGTGPVSGAIELSNENWWGLPDKRRHRQSMNQARDWYWHWVKAMWSCCFSQLIGQKGGYHVPRIFPVGYSSRTKREKGRVGWVLNAIKYILKLSQS